MDPAGGGCKRRPNLEPMQIGSAATMRAHLKRGARRRRARLRRCTTARVRGLPTLEVAGIDSLGWRARLRVRWLAGPARSKPAHEFLAIAAFGCAEIMKGAPKGQIRRR